MRKTVLGLVIGCIIGLVFSTQAADITQFVAQKATFPILVNGETFTSDKPIVVISGSTYLPLKALGDALGSKVVWNADSKRVEIGEAHVLPTPTPSPVVLPTTITQNNISVTITKVEQDDDSLKISVTYKNDSSGTLSTLDSLCKIVSNGKQYEYNTDFNFERTYEKNVDVASSQLEPGVSANSVIFFPPIIGVDRINIVLSPQFEDYRFNGIKVDIK